MRRILLVLAAFVATTPARAQPLLLPAHDVAVEYHSSGMIPGPAGARTNTVMARFDSGTGQLRIDGPYGGFYAIVDIGAARMFVVMPDQRLYAEQPADPVIMEMLRPGNAALRPVGVETVAGLACTDYDAAVNDHHGRVCLTDDGGPLHATIAEPDRRPALEAVQVTYGKQPDRMFEIPRGFQRLDLPGLPLGLDLGPLAGPSGGYRGYR